MNNLNTHKTVILLLVIVIGLIGCSESARCKEKLKGVWVISDAKYYNENIKGYLSINMLTFHDTYDCEIPTIYQLEESKCTWLLNATNDTLIISSSKNVLAGRYKISFYDSNKYSFVVLRSDSILFKAQKW